MCPISEMFFKFVADGEFIERGCQEDPRVTGCIKSMVNGEEGQLCICDSSLCNADEEANSATRQITVWVTVFLIAVIVITMI